MKIFTVITDDNCGTNLSLFTSEQKADAHAMTWLKSQWWTECHGKMPEDCAEALEAYGAQDNENYIHYETHAVENEASAALGQLLEQVYQMQGMFRDEDGAIARAVEDAEAAL